MGNHDSLIIFRKLKSLNQKTYKWIKREDRSIVDQLYH